ncbi:MAG: hypothetical protein LAP86_30770 [Acidobacteriia bacterium]|nr:hypothetical protein [Terriglobia bacterium]
MVTSYNGLGPRLVNSTRSINWRFGICGGLLYVGVEDAFLLQVVRHGVLGEKRCLEADFGAYPFALGVGSVGWVVAAAAAAELGAEIGGLDLVELVDLFPGGIAYRTGDVDF